MYVALALPRSFRSHGPCDASCFNLHQCPPAAATATVLSEEESDVSEVDTGADADVEDARDDSSTLQKKLRDGRMGMVVWDVMVSPSSHLALSVDNITSLAQRPWRCSRRPI